VLEEGTSGVWVEGRVQFHSLKPKPEILVRRRRRVVVVVAVIV
jgi:hypothetical protein